MITETPRKTCGRCGVSFGCSSHVGGCWCETLPNIVEIAPSGDCLCPACLAREIGGRIESFIAGVPHDEALRAALAEPKGRPPVEWIDYTIENGDAVFTSWYLLKQGECCGNGCRNCPYPAAQ